MKTAKVAHVGEKYESVSWKEQAGLSSLWPTGLTQLYVPASRNAWRFPADGEDWAPAVTLDGGALRPRTPCPELAERGLCAAARALQATPGPGRALPAPVP